MRGVTKVRVTRYVREEVEVVVDFENDAQPDMSLWKALFNRALEKGKRVASHDTYHVAKQYGYVHPLDAEIDIRVIYGHIEGS